MQTTTEWAREHGTPFRFATNLDNYEPPRRQGSGEGWFYESPDENRDGGVILADASIFSDNGRDCLFVLDDGRSIRVMYVASWHPEGVHLILHDLPLNVDKDGNPRLRKDDQRPVNFDTWMLGPSRTYHLKVRTDA